MRMVEEMRCEASCYNVYTLIDGWTLYTPEFESTIVSISPPLTLLVALWGMTSKATLQLMKPAVQESPASPMIKTATMPQSVL